eukprot:SAG11_NODE_3262_length_2571_cov_2.300971_2_plen_77_part_00
MRDASDDPDEQHHCDALGSSTVTRAGGMIQESVRRGTRPRVLAWGMLYPGPRKYPVVQILCVPSDTAVGPIKHVGI